MRRFLLLLCTAIACSFSTSAAPDAQDLLRASDAIRNPGRPFSVKVTLTEFESGKQVDTSTLASYSRAQEENGQFASLMRNGDDLWFFDPNTKASVRLSPQQRLIGQASNGDVVTVNLAKDYKAELLSEEETQDGDRRTRRAYKLGLNAANAAATYPRVEFWIDVENNRPIKGRFFADSGRLLKTVFYRRYALQLGRDRPTETVIIDGINPQSVTLMRYSDFSTPNIPQIWFQREHLPRFQPD